VNAFRTSNCRSCTADLRSWRNEVQIPSVRNCLIVCCLFTSSVIAQNTSQSAPGLLEQAVESGSDVSSSPGVSGVDTDSELPAVAPSSSGQAGNGNGNANGNGSSSAGTSRSKASPASTSTTYVFPSSGEMNRYWLRNTVGPKAFIGGTFTASWNTWVTDSPDEWGQDGTGWSKRFGSSLLDNGINTSTLVLLSRAMNQDPRYYRCDCSGLWPRTRHAIEMVYRARNRSGDLTFSPPRLIAPFTGPMVTRNTIYPDSFGFSDAFRGGGYYLAGSVGWNLIREFFGKKLLF
jgi:hypothetical protein